MLTQRQEDFTIHYFKTGNPTQSAVFAGYSIRSATVAASRLLTNDNIQARLAELRSPLAISTIMPVKERQEVLTEIGRGRFGEFADSEGHLDIPNQEALNSAALQEVKTTHFTGGKDGRASETTTTIKLRDPISAIQELNKMDHVYEVGTVNNNQQIIVVTNIPRPEIKDE